MHLLSRDHTARGPDEWIIIISRKITFTEQLTFTQISVLCFI